MDAEEPRIEIRRSTRRRRTISARREGNTTILMVPAGLSEAEVQKAARDLGAKLDAKAAARRGPISDDALMLRARELSDLYLEGRAVPTSVRWVTNQNHRWGSCTPATGVIRLSHRLQKMPDYVVDDVLLHELAHLLVAGHGPRFRELERRHPHHERAAGFLEGVSWRQ